MDNQGDPAYMSGDPLRCINIYNVYNEYACDLFKERQMICCNSNYTLIVTNTGNYDTIGEIICYCKDITNEESQILSFLQMFVGLLFMYFIVLFLMHIRCNNTRHEYVQIV
jgi:hypothetical protein